MAASNAIRQPGGGQGPRGRRPGYRRRRPLPAISILVLLAIVAIVVWVTAVRSTSGEDKVMECPAPSGGKSVGKTLPTSGLDAVSPQTPAQVPVSVLNGASERGKATMVSTILDQMGFSKTGDPSNDTVYQQGSLDCHGQIRFGQAGERSARTLSLVDPCAQLVRDNRSDASVDYVIGEKFDDLRPSDASQKLIKQLNAAADGGDGGIDRGLLRKAHDVADCE